MLFLGLVKLYFRYFFTYCYIGEILIIDDIMSYGNRILKVQGEGIVEENPIQ